ncbi:MAG: tRNA (adenosine(37)-N6)-threonylcarbamoyltransferase complex transferase subunit TsaD, partial [Candidatus Eisenbacteria bacterium]|nr:tRNA (adenosine(37)-N6)-threonylcarbamoyltransferase complex transferase subunit TsaD [Candidatus Latescibacterota bacterium]MBD3300877.1 tRNA (adenosine(37)-N6)-threonylcarbamoyltransferase complex transferase subunit TsaD [Candidatus Eisenbacteria bacterium]
MYLAIETSCDDTCAAVLSETGEPLASVVSSQLVHGAYEGVVPEIASREHLRLGPTAVRIALERAGIGLEAIRGIAVTRGPGLIGCLLVGLNLAKG